MYTFDCFTDKRIYPTVITPPGTAHAEAFIAAQRAPLGPVITPCQSEAAEDAARAWLAHVNAGRIGAGVR